MLERWMMDQALSRLIKRGGLSVWYWDGTSVNYGPNPNRDVTVVFKTPAACRKVLLGGTVGLGEAYSEGSLDIEGPIEDLQKVMFDNIDSTRWFDFARQLAPNTANRKATQQRQIQHHYDVGNDFYKMWLDESMTYSCAYFRDENDSLEVAQEQKRAHILRKLQLKPGMRVLDIGSGWGHLIADAVTKHDVEGVGITLSQEQLRHCREMVRERGLEGRLRFELINYQDLAAGSERFDRIVSVGMFEHVGKGNHGEYFKSIKRMLKPDGLSLLHTISTDKEWETNAWVDKYIFPGGYLPSARSVVAQLPEYGFSFLDYENLRMHYAMTLAEWHRRFEAHKADVIAMHDERFYRMWKLYLAMCAGAFKWRLLNLSQVVFAGPAFEPALTREHMYPAPVVERVVEVTVERPVERAVARQHHYDSLANYGDGRGMGSNGRRRW
jgi:cyclopropane-fatty-acyl-phospholipid synthase